MREKTYHLLIGGALRAVFFVLAVKLVGVIVFANWSGATIEVRTFLKFVPYFAVFADGLTFLNILDSSPEADAAMSQYEILNGKSGVPLTYVIDRDGKIIDAWYGHDPERTTMAVEKLDLEERK